MISDTQVRQLARLARLELDGAERERIAQELGQILALFAKLDELDAKLSEEAVPPTAHALPLDCPLRPDLLGDDYHRDQTTHHELVERAPRSEDGFFIVPRVLE